MKPSSKQVDEVRKSFKKCKWVALHWLSGKVHMVGKEKDIKKWCKSASFNKKAPLYYPVPIAGIYLIAHIGYDQDIILKGLKGKKKK